MDELRNILVSSTHICCWFYYQRKFSVCSLSPNLQIHSFTEVKKHLKGVRRHSKDESLLVSGHQCSKNVQFFWKLASSGWRKRQQTVRKKKTYNDQNPLHWLPSKATPTAFLQEMEPVLCLLNIQHDFKVQIIKKYEQNFTKIKCFGGCFQLTSTALKTRLQHPSVQRGRQATE